MARPDVPIAKWVGSPMSFTAGRRSGQPSVIVIHTTEGHEDTASAEDGAHYDKIRTDGTSTHFFVDPDSVVQEVELRDEAHAARTHGNDIGIQIELCGRSDQSSAQWNDTNSSKILENLAMLCVQLRQRGNYPLVRLQGQGLRDAWNVGQRRGFCGHVDITYAFPEDNGTHTDPGGQFPWNWLFGRIAALEEDMTAEDIVNADILTAPGGNGKWSLGDFARNTYTEAKNTHTQADKTVAAQIEQAEVLSDLKTKVVGLQADVIALQQAVESLVPKQ